MAHPEQRVAPVPVAPAFRGKPGPLEQRISRELRRGLKEAEEAEKDKDEPPAKRRAGQDPVIVPIRAGTAGEQWTPGVFFRRRVRAPSRSGGTDVAGRRGHAEAQGATAGKHDKDEHGDGERLEKASVQHRR